MYPYNQPTPNVTISRTMAHPILYPRYVETRLTEALADTPEVLIHGPRQAEETTLARMVGERTGYVYFSFDDDVAASA
jgi:hypothetical protein